MKPWLHLTSPTILFVAAGPAHAAAGTGAAATTVLVVFGAVVLAALALTVAAVLWLRSRRWRLRLADERATLDGVMGAAEDLLATADDGYLIWPAGGERAAASEKLGRMFRLEAFAIADIDVLESAFEPVDFSVFRRAIGALRSDGVAFDLDLARAAPATTTIRCRGLLAVSGAAVVWMRDLADTETLLADFEARLSAAAGDADRLRALLDGAPYPVWRRGIDLGVVWANNTYCQAVEAPLADVVERAVELVSGIAPAEARELARGARESDETRIERRRFVVAGERRTYELTETPMSDGEVAGYGRDVTDRDDAAGDLTRHLDSQNEVLNQVKSAIAIFGPDRQLVFHNASFARLWRLDEDWLASSPDHGAILERLRETRRLPETADFPAYKSGVLDLYTSVLSRQEDQLHLPDGSTLRVVITPHPKDGLLFIYEDLSDQLELERARNTLAAVQRATLDNLFEGVAVFGADGRLKLFNRGYARLWRLENDDLIGEPHVADLVEAARPLFREAGDEAV
jgi:PAS domain-containing protein